MIITEEVNIHIKGIEIKRYKELGYIVDTKGLNCIKVKDLPKNSMIKVLVKCDNCKKTKELKIQDYYSSFKNNKYNCIECKHETYKNTMIQKYGVENIFQLNEIKEKSKHTKLKKYNDENYNNRNKASETCLEIYGVENPHQNTEIKQKINNTNLEKYGFNTASKNENIKEKAKNTKKLKYNDEFFNNRDKYKNTIIEKYTVDNPMKNENIFIKSQITGLKRKYYKNTKLLYQGSYELDFLNKYNDKIIIENGPYINIEYNNKKTIYYSDFYIKDLNLIIEIKSSYWYTKYYNKNEIKMKECIKLGYNYIIIINKKYEEFDNIINKNS